MSLDLSSLSMLFGVSGSTVAAGGDPAGAIALFKTASTATAQAKGVAQQAKDPVTLQAVKQFQAALAKAKDLNSALRDPRVLNVLLPAEGLADQTAFPGLAQKALTADPKATNGLLANIDGRWKTAATALGLKTKGLAGLTDPAVQAALIKKFTSYQYQHGLDQQQAGISDALYFSQNASSGASNVYSILGDAILRRVVTGALGLPPQLAVQPIEAQAQAITSRLNIAQLNQPKQVDKLIQRYLVNSAQNGTGSSGGSNPILSLFA